MQSNAILRHARIGPQKARLVADLIRGQDVSKAIEMLRFTPKKGAGLIQKLVESAVANAEQAATRTGEEIDIDDLFVHTILVDGGSSLRRFRPRAHGRATKILKKTSHITVVLETR
jgi:large subunit ribosomal protein L22